MWNGRKVPPHLMNAPGIGHPRRSPGNVSNKNSFKKEMKAERRPQLDIGFPQRSSNYHSQSTLQVEPQLIRSTSSYNTSKKDIKVMRIIIMNSKACNAAPEVNDFGFECQIPNLKDQYQKLLLEQYGFDPLGNSLTDFRPLQKVIVESPKIENSSQYVNPVNTTETDTWCNDAEIDPVIRRDGGRYIPSRQDILISEVPRIKVVAEKFTRLKNNKLEIRKLDEKIVCLEYDVYDKMNFFKEPVEVMRAYFSITSGCKSCTDKCTFLSELPASMRVYLSVDEKNINDIAEKEVEILDEKVLENRFYLEDLKRVLQRKNAINFKKTKSSLDLNCMYDMARQELPPLDYDYSNTNLLSKKELQEIESIIMKNCDSRVNNLCRKKVKDVQSSNTKTKNENDIYELLRTMGKKLT